MKQTLLKQLTYFYVAVAFSLTPAIALAQNNQPGTTTLGFATIDCQKVQAIPQPASLGFGDTIKSMVTDSLKSMFTRGSLHDRLFCDPMISGWDAIGKHPTTSVYKVALGVVNFGVLIALLIIAFANILRIKLDTYAVKKSVPLLVFGVIMANLGLPVIRTIVDFAGVISATFIGQISEAGTKTGFVNELISAVYKGGAGTVGSVLNGLNGTSSKAWFGLSGFLGLLGITIVGITAMGPFVVVIFVGAAFLIFFPAIMFLILGLLFVARIYMIVILAAVSPAAFATLGIEQLRGPIWGWWWKHFIKWTFMTPAVFALFWLAIIFYRSVGASMDIGTYIITMFLLYYATQVPLKLGGTVMGKWNEWFVKPVGNFINKPFTAGAAYVRKAVPRDIRRFLSTPPTWLTRGKFRTLNFPQIISKALETIEKRNAEREARSPAVSIGRDYGELIASLGTKRAIFDSQGRSQFFEGRLGTTEGRQVVMQRARDVFRNIADPTQFEWKDLNLNQQAQFNERIKQMHDSGDREAIQAAMLAHGLIGKDLTPGFTGSDDPNKQEYFLHALRQRGITDTQTLQVMYERLATAKTKIPTVSNYLATQRGLTDQRQAAEFLATELERKLAPILKGRDEPKKLQTLEAIRGKLDQVKVELVKLEEIQKDPAKLGIVRSLFEANDSLRPGAALDQVKSIIREFGLDQHRAGVGMPAVRAIFRIDENTSNINNINNLKPLISGDGLDMSAYQSLIDTEQREDIIKIFTDIGLRRQIKADLLQFLQAQLGDIVNDPTVVNQVTEQLLKPKIKTDLDDALPEKIELGELTGPSVGLNPEQAEAFQARLRPYQAFVNSAETFKEADAEARATVGPATAAAVGGTATPPDATTASTAGTPAAP